MGLFKWLLGGRKIKGDDYNALVDSAELSVPSEAPDGTYKVTNIYVELVEGNPKLRVEYEV